MTMRCTNIVFALTLTILGVTSTPTCAQPDSLFTHQLGTQGVSKLVDDYIQRLQTNPLFKDHHDLEVLNDPLGHLGIKSMATSLVSTALNYPDYFTSSDMQPMFRLSQKQWYEASAVLDETLAASSYNQATKRLIKQRLTQAQQVLVLVENP